MFIISTTITPAVAQDDSVSTQEAKSYIKKVHRIYAKHFYDDNMHGVNWDQLLEKVLNTAEKVQTRTQLYELTNRMIAELDASHTGVYTPYASEHFLNPILGKTEKAEQLGVMLMKDGDQYFVGRLWGPASNTDIMRGDQVVSINGTPASSSDRLEPIRPHLNISYFIGIRGDDSIQLTVRHKSMGSGETVEISPERTNLAEDSMNDTRIMERSGKKIAYVHFWHFMSKPMYSEISSAIKGRLQKADGLIIDLRGRGGKVQIMEKVLNLFGYENPNPAWDKPVVAVVDGSCTSAKEIFSYHWKENNLGPLVGQKTKGAVLRGTFKEMSDGSTLEIAVGDADNLTEGKELEGVGVQPDIRVKPQIKYAQGDRVLDKGIEVLLKEIKK